MGGWSRGGGGEEARTPDGPDPAGRVGGGEGAVLPEADSGRVHWRGVTHCPLAGDDAAGGVIAGAGGFTRVVGRGRTAEYRLDVLRADGSVARAFVCDTTNLLYAAADEQADFGAAQGLLTVSLAALGLLAGAGAPTRARLPVRSA